MSITILVLGQSGCGKSASIRNLNPDETFVINVLGKILPFRHANKFTIKPNEDRTTGNYFASNDAEQICRVIKFINTKRPDIKNIIIDDFFYIQCHEFMEKALINNFQKFTEIANNSYKVINALRDCRDDIFGVVLTHSQIDADGMSVPKNIGKLLDEKVHIQGMMTCVFHAVIVEGSYKFLTQNNGQYMARSLMGMFEHKLIDNDLQYIKDSIQQYFNQDTNQ